jgi:hypothetical protein
MSRYLGYDRELVGALRTAMRRCSDQLQRLRCDDIEATDALTVARSGQQLFDEVWIPVLDGLLACTALDDRRPVQLDLGDLRNAVLIDRQVRGWQITTDPVASSGPSVVLADEAAAIGRRLAADDEPWTDTELLWLIDRLAAIATDPMAASVLRAQLDDAGWATVFDRLGLDRLQQVHLLSSDPDARGVATRREQLDTLIATLAGLYAVGPHTGHAPWYPTVVGQLDPYSAALVATALDLDPRVAAAVVDDVLTRWLDGHDDERLWADQFSAGDNAADLLFRWLATDTEAARRFVERASPLPDLLFRTAHDDTTVVGVLLAGTSPTTVAAADAGAVIRPLLEWAGQRESSLGPTSDGGVDNVRAVLAPVVAPWLFQLGPRADEWGWTVVDGDDALRWVIADEQAAAELIASLDSWHRQLAVTPLMADDGRIDDVALHDLASLFAQVQVAMRDEELADAAADRFWADAMFMAGQVLVSALVPGGPAVSVGADLALSGFSPISQQWLQQHGLPHDPDEDVVEIEARFGSRTTDTAVVAVVGVVGQLIERGELPPEALDTLHLDDLGDGCEPAVVDERLHEFVRGLEGSLDAATSNGLTSVLYAFSNPLGIAQQC